jgi:hypothetical protein
MEGINAKTCRDAACLSHVRWFDTLTGRVDYLVQPNILLYSQGGAAKASFTFNDPTGLVVGQIAKYKSG